VMPLARTCTTAISAACHPPQNEDLDTIALGPVMWGETTEQPIWMARLNHVCGVDERKGHCSSTSFDAMEPSLIQLYT
jgi:hypothetical protein